VCVCVRVCVRARQDRGRRAEEFRFYDVAFLIIYAYNDFS